MKLQLFLSSVIQLISNHFEEIFVIVVSLLFMSLVVLILARIRTAGIQAAQIRGFFQEVIGGGILIFLIGMVVMMEYVFWQNYRPEAGVEKEVVFTFQDDTAWIKRPIKIYYVKAKELHSIGIHGRNDRVVFRADDDIREYRFSPNGRYLLVLSSRSLFLIDRFQKKVVRVETLAASLPRQPAPRSGAGRISPLGVEKNKEATGWGSTDGKKQFKGSISGLQWSPDSQKFCYQASRWSDFSSQENAYVYDLRLNRKQAVKSFGRKIALLTWDTAGSNLYYFFYEAKETSLYTYPFDVKVFRIAMKDLGSELVAQIPYDQRRIPTDNLAARGIELFLDGERLAFTKSLDDQWTSEKGQQIGIDENGYFFFIKNRWFQRRLFSVPRRADATSGRYPYGGGDLLIDQFRWLPGGRYVIMRHHDYGFLITEPESGRIGLLGIKDGECVGWFDPSVERHIRILGKSPGKS